MRVAVFLAGAMLAAPVAMGQDQPAVKPEAQPAATGATENPTGAEQENLPSAESLLEKHIAAAGGMEAMKGERNRVVRAKCAIPARSAEGFTRVLRIAPNRYYAVVEIPGLSTSEFWCNPEGAWVRDTNRGSRRLTGEELAEMKLQADFLGEAGYKSRYREVKTVARERLNDAEVFVVNAVPHEGKARRLYFDAGTGLLSAIRQPGPSGPDSDTVLRFFDYKKFGDVMHPTRTVTTVGNLEVSTITVTNVESNLSVMPSIDPPDEVKSLK